MHPELFTGISFLSLIDDSKGSNKREFGQNQEVSLKEVDEWLRE